MNSETRAAREQFDRGGWRIADLDPISLERCRQVDAGRLSLQEVNDEAEIERGHYVDRFPPIRPFIRVPPSRPEAPRNRSISSSRSGRASSQAPAKSVSSIERSARRRTV